MNVYLFSASGGAGVAWLISGVMWVKSARVKTRQRLQSVAEVTQSPFDGSIGASVETFDVEDLPKALERQNRLNGYAAWCSCVGAVLSAIAAGISAFSH